MSLLTDHTTLIFILSCTFGLFMAWGIGANDVANAMGTSVGSKALTLKQAIIIAIIFEFLGAWLAGGDVTATVRKGIVDPTLFTENPDLLVIGMLSALLAAGTWLLIASWRGWPVSTTHSIVGAIVGFAAVGISFDAVAWPKVGKIAASWVVSPALAGTLSILIFTSVKLLVLDRQSPIQAAKKYLPIYMFLVGFLIASVTLIKGLKHVFKDHDISLTLIQTLGIAAIFGVIVTICGASLLRKVVKRVEADNIDSQQKIENVFAILMIFTACAMAFAHGSNDVANAVGPLAAIIGVLENGAVTAKSMLPWWILLIGGLGIVLGLATYGYRVMKTIGEKITELTPSRGFAAELAAAGTVVLASTIGLPISTTHTLVGAVLGVGIAQGIASLQFKVIWKIIASWLVTIPVGAGLAILFFYMFSAMFGL